MLRLRMNGAIPPLAWNAFISCRRTIISLYLAEGQSYLYRTGAEFLPTIALQFYLILYFSVYKDLISAA